ncbi:MAG: class I SAM-dependent methyltransferase [Acidobacteria bacterium]|nr:class I SAM-dependent methyltransferase [Acidobacteriota bacterium]
MSQPTALDWGKVLRIASENAAARGLADRHTTIVGDAFEVDFGGSYDLVLLTNFLHHFDPLTCESLLAKAHAALKEGGRAVTLEFVPNDDRISPPTPALFAMTMLVTTPSGDAYTFGELEAMAAAAGFSRSELHPLEPTFQSGVISYK